METPTFLSDQLISYRGNKRKLLSLLSEGLGLVAQRLGRRRFRIFDGFSGSGVCARFFKQHADLLLVNDLQPYAATLATCFLTNRSTVDRVQLQVLLDDLEARKFEDTPGFIQDLYAPQDDENVRPGERVYFTRSNARILDGACRRLAEAQEDLRPLVLGPLLAEVSIRSNTAGHFKSFLKDRTTGVGCLGGSGGSRADRMKADITFRAPVLSAYECECRVFCEDTSIVVADLPELDIAYFDPPYDTESYGALYWMLNLIVRYERPTKVSRIAGVPHDWLRSGFSRKHGVDELLDKLIEEVPARFVLLSYSNESSISEARIAEMLENYGSYRCLERRHRRFNSSHQSAKHGTRGARHVRPQVIERLYVLEKR